MGKSDPFWLWAVTDSDDVAVVPVPEPEPVPEPCGAASAIFAVRRAAAAAGESVVHASHCPMGCATTGLTIWFTAHN